MTRAGRGYVGAALSLVVTAGTWCLCALVFELDLEASVAIATLAAGLAGAVASMWITEGRRGTSPGAPRQSVDPRPMSDGAPILIRVGTVPKPAHCMQPRPKQEHALAGAIGKVTVIVGQGGVGKTQLAGSFAQQKLTRGELDLLIWTNASSLAAVVDTFAEAATALGLISSANRQSSSCLLTWLQDTNKRWLVVLDDVVDPAVVKDLLPTPTTTGQVLMTTRRRDANVTEGRVVVEVEVFAEAESVAYLEQKLGSKGVQMAQVRELARDLGHLPLALAQAAAYMQNRGLDCSTYRTRLADQRRRLNDLFPAESAFTDDHRAAVSATWSLSISLADELEPRGLASCLLEILSVLAPSGSLITLFRNDAVLAYLDAHRTAGSGSVASADDAQDGLYCLQRLSLVSIDGSDARRIVRVHALLQRVVRESLDRSRRGEAIRTAADSLVNTWPWPETSIEVSQIFQSNAYTVGEVDPDALWNDGTVPQLFQRLGKSLGETGDAVAAADYFDQLSANASSRLGREHRDTLGCRKDSAYWRGEGGDEARALGKAQELAADTERILGFDDLLTLEASFQVARWLGETGDAVGAVGAYERVLPSYVNALGEVHPNTMRVRSWLAYMRGESGNVRMAVADFDQLVTDRTRVLGSDHRDTLAARHLAARWRAVGGEYATAVSLTEALLMDYLRVLGPDHPDTLHIRHSLARWWGYAGDPGRAVAAFEALLVDRERVLGRNHIYTLATRYQLARWRGEAGDREGAERGFAALITDYERILGPDRRETEIARSNLAYWRGELLTLPDDVTRRSAH